MSSQASASRAVIPGGQKGAHSLGNATPKPSLLAWLQTWKQVLLAELLNVLERRRYDFKPFR